MKKLLLLFIPLVFFFGCDDEDVNTNDDNNNLTYNCVDNDCVSEESGEYESLDDCLNMCDIEIILGCMEADALNYNPEATENDPDNPCDYNLCSIIGTWDVFYVTFNEMEDHMYYCENWPEYANPMYDLGTDVCITITFNEDGTCSSVYQNGNNTIVEDGSWIYGDGWDTESGDECSLGEVSATITGNDVFLIRLVHSIWYFDGEYRMKFLLWNENGVWGGGEPEMMSLIRQ